MHNVQRTALILLVVGVGAILVICLYPGKQELIYQGRSIDYWFAELPVTLVLPEFVATGASLTVLGQQYGNEEDTSMSFAALDAFGIDAIPYLMKKLTGKDSAIEQAARNAARRVKIKSFPTRMAAIERGQAATGLIYMKELPPETVRTLTNLSRTSNSGVADAAKYILSKINTDQAVMPDGHQSRSKSAKIGLQIDAATQRD